MEFISARIIENNKPVEWNGLVWFGLRVNSPARLRGGATECLTTTCLSTYTKRNS